MISTAAAERAGIAGTAMGKTFRASSTSTVAVVDRVSWVDELVVC